MSVPLFRPDPPVAGAGTGRIWHIESPREQIETGSEHVVTDSLRGIQNGKGSANDQGKEIQDHTESDRRGQVETILVESSPIDEKCGLLRPSRDASRSVKGKAVEQCCKELKGDDERHLIDPAIVRDVVIGLSDGLTVPFALTAGLSAIGSSRLVVSAGLAELIAGAISMGVGGYLASQAELDHFHYTLRQTRERVDRSCSTEMEREVHSILGPLGVRESLSRLIANDLRRVEDEVQMQMQGAAGSGYAGEGVMGVNKDKVEMGQATNDGKGTIVDGFPPATVMRRIVRGDRLKSPDMGLTAFLLKYGEGMEEVPRSRLYISALTIGFSYFIGGLIPLIPYLADTTAQTGLIISSAVTGTVLLIFGAFKTYFTGARGGVSGYLWGAISTLLVGGSAAVAAYFLVKALHVQE